MMSNGTADLDILLSQFRMYVGSKTGRTSKINMYMLPIC